MHIILVGPPGAGKGTQASRLIRERNMVQISTGEILRAAAQAGTPRAEQVRVIMASGQLLPDAFVAELLGERLDQLDGTQSVIFDGFPRTLNQATTLDGLLKARDRCVDMVIEFAVNETVLVERVVGRFACATCGEGYNDSFRPPIVEGTCDRCGGYEFSRRPDDNVETAHARLAIYRTETGPILAHYDAHGLVRRVDGTADMDTVTAQIEEVLEQAVRPR